MHTGSHRLTDACDEKRRACLDLTLTLWEHQVLWAIVLLLDVSPWSVSFYDFVCAFVCLCVWTEGWGNRVIELFLDSGYPLQCCSFSDADRTMSRVTIGERNMCLCLHMCLYSSRHMHTLYVCICMYMCVPACTAPACVEEYFSHLCAESPRFPPCLSSSVFLSLWLVFLLPLCITTQAATLKCREHQQGLWLSQGLMLSFR